MINMTLAQELVQRGVQVFAGSATMPATPLVPTFKVDRAGFIYIASLAKFAVHEDKTDLSVNMSTHKDREIYYTTYGIHTYYCIIDGE